MSDTANSAAPSHPSGSWPTVTAPEAPVVLSAAEELARRLEIRSKELLSLYRHIQRNQQQQAQAADLAARAEDLQRREDTWNRSRAEIEAVLAARVEDVSRQHEANLKAEAALAGQLADLARQTAEWQQQRQAIPAQDPEKEALRQEVEQLRNLMVVQPADPALSTSLEKQKQELAEKVAELERAQQVAMAWADKEEEGLRKQLEKTRGRLAEREESEARLTKALEKQSADFEAERSQLRKEIIGLRLQLDQKTAQLAEVLAKGDPVLAGSPGTETVPQEAAPPEPVPEPVVEAEPTVEAEVATEEDAVPSFEAPLSQLRRQLEEDRRELQLQVEKIQEQQEAVEFGDSERKIKPARERAALASEQDRLNRLREMLRTETERLQREDGLRPRLDSAREITPSRPSGNRGTLHGVRKPRTP